MSYQVSHKLSVIGIDASFAMLLKHFKNDAEALIEQVGDCKYFFSGEGVYDDERDKVMLKVSKEFPAMLFKITTTWEAGMGGEVTDNYYMDGKKAHYTGVMVMPEFNIEDLE